MLKYVLIGLLIVGMLISMYQLYLNNAWTNLVKHKQAEYSKSPVVVSSNKEVVHRMEMCALTLVCVLFLPAQLGQQSRAVPNELEEVAPISEDVLKSDEDMKDKLNAPNAQLVSTGKGADQRTLPDSEYLIQMLYSNPEEVVVSLDMLNPSAKLYEVEDFLALFANQDLFLSNQTTMDTCDYIVRISSDSIQERELLFKEEDDKFILCDSLDEICFYLKK